MSARVLTAVGGARGAAAPVVSDGVGPAEAGAFWVLDYFRPAHVVFVTAPVTHKDNDVTMTS